jgi:hypothetical protein
MAPYETVDALCGHVGEECLSDGAVQQGFGGLGVAEQERQIEDLDARKERFQKPGGVERHVDDAGLHAGHDVDLAAELAAGKHLNADRAAGLGGDQFGELRRHSLSGMQRCIRMAELEGGGTLGIGAIGSPDCRHGDRERASRGEELLARYVGGHGRSRELSEAGEPAATAMTSRVQYVARPPEISNTAPVVNAHSCEAQNATK